MVDHTYSSDNRTIDVTHLATLKLYSFGLVIALLLSNQMHHIYV